MKSELRESMSDIDEVRARGGVCIVCGKDTALNYGYCLECSGRRGFS